MLHPNDTVRFAQISIFMLTVNLTWPQVHICNPARFTFLPSNQLYASRCKSYVVTSAHLLPRKISHVPFWLSTDFTTLAVNLNWVQVHICNPLRSAILLFYKLTTLSNSPGTLVQSYDNRSRLFGKWAIYTYIWSYGTACLDEGIRCIQREIYVVCLIPRPRLCESFSRSWVSELVYDRSESRGIRIIIIRPESSKRVVDQPMVSLVSTDS